MTKETLCDESGNALWGERLRMRSLFAADKAFNQPLSLDTSSVTNMQYMFYQAN